MANRIRQRKRVKKQAEAAEFLGISPSRLQEFGKPGVCEWWDESFRNADGYDVVGIAKAQTAAEVRRQHGSSGGGQSDQEKQLAEAQRREALAAAEIKLLEQRKRQRLEMEAEKELVSAQVVISLFTEALSDLRTRLDDLPYRFAQQVPDDFKPLVFQDGEDSALLEEFVREVVLSFEDFWEVMSSELFDPAGDQEGVL